MAEEKSEDKQPPQRLQSLSSGNRGGMRGGRGGRFLPNAVGRRSREERESTAPAMKAADPAPPERRQGARKSERRAKRQLGTRAEAAGPLSAPAIAQSTRTAASSGGTVSGGAQRTRASVKVKQDPDTQPVIVHPDQRIDISSTETDSDAYFPVRMPSEPTLKDQPPKSATGALPGQIADVNNSHFDLKEGALYLVQLPELGLRAGKPPAGSLLAPGRQAPSKEAPSKEAPSKEAMPAVVIKEETGDVSMPDAEVGDARQVATENDENGKEKRDDEPGSAGLLGTLRTHASGKVTMVIGNTVYDVMAGSKSRSAEEVMAVDPESKKAFELGPVEQRLLVVPSIDSLHI